MSQARSNAGVAQPQRRVGSSGQMHAVVHQLTPLESAWIEVSSQPSSSSLSSIGDEIVTTGLQVGNPYVRRRRRVQPHQQQTTIYVTGTGSQEEFDESESEDERLLSSSNENVQPSESGEEINDSDLDSDDGDNATALGRLPDQQVFRPQPNAFSHPPAHPQRSHSSPNTQHPHSEFTRPSFTQRSQTRAQRGPNFMSPSVREDNDAALRASLTTLLSCAAAARGLPKTKEEAEAQRAASTGVGPSNQPVDLRLVPESELSLEKEPSRPQRVSAVAPSPQRKRSSPARSPTRADGNCESSRHASVASRSPRATKKKKTAQMVNEPTISPTLLTWVVSAGVVVLVSVVGFGAGYVIGREVGKQEALSVSVGGVNETTSCGREVIRSSGSGLRRLRWGAAARSIVASN